MKTATIKSTRTFLNERALILEMLRKPTKSVAFKNASKESGKTLRIGWHEGYNAFSFIVYVKGLDKNNKPCKVVYQHSLCDLDKVEALTIDDVERNIIELVTITPIGLRFLAMG